MEREHDTDNACTMVWEQDQPGENLRPATADVVVVSDLGATSQTKRQVTRIAEAAGFRVHLQLNTKQRNGDVAIFVRKSLASLSRLSTIVSRSPPHRVVAVEMGLVMKRLTKETKRTGTASKSETLRYRLIVAGAYLPPNHSTRADEVRKTLEFIETQVLSLAARSRAASGPWRHVPADIVITGDLNSGIREDDAIQIRRTPSDAEAGEDDEDSGQTTETITRRRQPQLLRHFNNRNGLVDCVPPIRDLSSREQRDCYFTYTAKREGITTLSRLDHSLAKRNNQQVQITAAARRILPCAPSDHGYVMTEVKYTASSTLPAHAKRFTHTTAWIEAARLIPLAHVRVRDTAGLWSEDGTASLQLFAIGVRDKAELDDKLLWDCPISLPQSCSTFKTHNRGAGLLMTFEDSKIIEETRDWFKQCKRRAQGTTLDWLQYGRCYARVRQRQHDRLDTISTPVLDRLVEQDELTDNTRAHLEADGSPIERQQQLLLRAEKEVRQILRFIRSTAASILGTRTKNGGSPRSRRVQLRRIEQRLPAGIRAARVALTRLNYLAKADQDNKQRWRAWNAIEDIVPADVRQQMKNLTCQTPKPAWRRRQCTSGGDRGRRQAMLIWPVLPQATILDIRQELKRRVANYDRFTTIRRRRLARQAERQAAITSVKEALWLAKEEIDVLSDSKAQTDHTRARLRAAQKALGVEYEGNPTQEDVADCITPDETIDRLYRRLREWVPATVRGLPEKWHRWDPVQLAKHLLPADMAHAKRQRVASAFDPSIHFPQGDPAHSDPFARERLATAWSKVLAPVSQHEYNRALAKPSTAPGPSGVTRKMLRFCETSLSEKLFVFVNACICAGHYPAVLGEGLVNPLPKKPGVPIYEACRPIVLLETLHKVITDIINDRLLSVLVTNDLLHPATFGFLPGRSAHEASMLQRGLQIHSELEKHPLFTLDVDISKAFDGTRAHTVLCSLMAKGAPDKLLHFIHKFITSATNSVACAEGVSKSYSGDVLRQGDPASTSLFVIALDPLLRLVHKQCKGYKLNDQVCITAATYADDLQSNHSSLEDAALATDLISDYLSINQQRANASKSLLRVSPREVAEQLNEASLPKLHGEKVRVCPPDTATRHLGIYTTPEGDPQASWERATEFIRSTAAIIRAAVPAIGLARSLINTVLAPRLRYMCGTIPPPPSILDQWDAKVARACTGLPAATRAQTFAPLRDGGIGVISPSAVVAATTARALTQALSHPSTRKPEWNQLHKNQQQIWLWNYTLWTTIYRTLGHTLNTRAFLHEIQPPQSLATRQKEKWQLPPWIENAMACLARAGVGITLPRSPPQGDLTYEIGADASSLLARAQRGQLVSRAEDQTITSDTLIKPNGWEINLHRLRQVSTVTAAITGLNRKEERERCPFLPVPAFRTPSPGTWTANDTVLLCTGFRNVGTWIIPELALYKPTRDGDRAINEYAVQVIPLTAVRQRAGSPWQTETGEEEYAPVAAHQHHGPEEAKVGQENTQYAEHIFYRAGALFGGNEDYAETLTYVPRGNVLVVPSSLADVHETTQERAGETERRQISVRLFRPNWSAPHLVRLWNTPAHKAKAVAGWLSSTWLMRQSPPTPNPCQEHTRRVLRHRGTSPEDADAIYAFCDGSYGNDERSHEYGAGVVVTHSNKVLSRSAIRIHPTARHLQARSPASARSELIGATVATALAQRALKETTTRPARAIVVVCDNKSVVDMFNNLIRVKEMRYSARVSLFKRLQHTDRQATTLLQHLIQSWPGRIRAIWVPAHTGGATNAASKAKLAKVSPIIKAAVPDWPEYNCMADALADSARLGNAVEGNDISWIPVQPSEPYSFIWTTAPPQPHDWNKENNLKRTRWVAPWGETVLRSTHSYTLQAHLALHASRGQQTDHDLTRAWESRAGRTRGRTYELEFRLRTQAGLGPSGMHETRTHEHAYGPDQKGCCVLCETNRQQGTRQQDEGGWEDRAYSHTLFECPALAPLPATLLEKTCRALTQGMPPLWWLRGPQWRHTQSLLANSTWIAKTTGESLVQRETRTVRPPEGQEGKPTTWMILAFGIRAASKQHLREVTVENLGSPRDTRGDQTVGSFVPHSARGRATLRLSGEAELLYRAWNGCSRQTSITSRQRWLSEVRRAGRWISWPVQAALHHAVKDATLLVHASRAPEYKQDALKAGMERAVRLLQSTEGASARVVTLVVFSAKRTRDATETWIGEKAGRDYPNLSIHLLGEIRGNWTGWRTVDQLTGMHPPLPNAIRLPCGATTILTVSHQQATSAHITWDAWRRLTYEMASAPAKHAETQPRRTETDNHGQRQSNTLPEAAQGEGRHCQVRIPGPPLLPRLTGSGCAGIRYDPLLRHIGPPVDHRQVGRTTLRPSDLPTAGVPLARLLLGVATKREASPLRQLTSVAEWSKMAARVQTLSLGVVRKLFKEVNKRIVACRRGKGLHHRLFSVRSVLGQWKTARRSGDGVYPVPLIQMTNAERTALVKLTYENARRKRNGQRLADFFTTTRKAKTTRNPPAARAPDWAQVLAWNKRDHPKGPQGV